MQSETLSQAPLEKPSRAYEIINRQNLAKIVGILAMALPIVLFIVGSLKSCSFDSISHYYYGPYTGTIFIGISSMVALALFAYSGKTKLETWMANIAAAALLVLLFIPTHGVGCEDDTLQVRAFATAEVSADKTSVNLAPFFDSGDPADDSGFVGIQQHFALIGGSSAIHLAAAGVFIAVLGYFCFFIFTRIDEVHKDQATGAVTSEKAERNRKYKQSGWIIVICLALLLVGVVSGLNNSRWWDGANLTFWLEAVAIIAFARSWLLKGRALIYNHLADKVEIEAQKICTS